MADQHYHVILRRPGNGGWFSPAYMRFESREWATEWARAVQPNGYHRMVRACPGPDLCDGKQPVTADERPTPAQMHERWRLADEAAATRRRRKREAERRAREAGRRLQAYEGDLYATLRSVNGNARP